MEEYDVFAPGLQNSNIPALLLYASKLELMISRLQKDLLTPEEMLYDMLPKEAMREALLMSFVESQTDDGFEEKMRKIVQTINKGAIDKIYSNGCFGAMWEEVQRLREEGE